MKALIIGAAGFVGKYLIAELLSDGYQVSGTKLPSESRAGNDCEMFDLDILGERAISELLNKVKPDKIFHLAAQSSSAIAWKNPQMTVDVNIKGALNLLEALRRLDYKPKTILVGSSEEYGGVNKVMPISEDMPVYPDSPYAITRSAQNRFGAIYAKAYGLDIVMTRSFNHIGVGHAETFAIPSFCKQIAEIALGRREPVLSAGNLSVMRDYIDVRDVCKAYAALSENGVSGETYNVGSGRAVSLQDIVNILIGFSGKKIKIRIDPEKIRPIDTPVIQADINKICKLTGWSPKVQLEQSLREVYEYYKSDCGYAKS